MKALCCLSLVICAVYGSGKASHNVYGILGDVMKEQLSVIKHCMTSRCTGRAHNRFRNIAFQAYPSKHLKDVAANTRVVFGLVTDNHGRAYDAQTGIFTAPIDGIYVFHWTTMVHPGKYFATILKVNGVSKAYNHAFGSNNKDWYSPSQMFVGSLRKGDKVWLSTDASVGQFMHQGIHSTFSGFLL